MSPDTPSNRATRPRIAVVHPLLRPGDFDVRLPGRAARAILATLPGNNDLFRTAYLLRLLAHLDCERPFDALLGTHDEMDLHGIESTVVHPPVPGGLAEVPWDDPVERDRLRAHRERQSALFSEDRFITELRSVVSAFLQQAGAAS